jgi:hypothetical protein
VHDEPIGGRRDHFVVHGSLALLLALLGPPVEAPTIPTGTSPELPLWTEAPIREPVSLEVPRDGGGAIVTGSVMLVSAVGMSVGAIALAGQPERDGEGWMGLGAVLVGAGGAGVLAAGVKARKKFRTTELGQVRRAPTTGRAMRAGGVLALSAAPVAFVAGAWMFNTVRCDHCFEPPSEALILMGVGPGLLVAGSVFLLVSSATTNNYRKWLRKRSTPLEPTFRIDWATIQIGVSGRF